MRYIPAENKKRRRNRVPIGDIRLAAEMLQASVEFIEDYWAERQDTWEPEDIEDCGGRSFLPDQPVGTEERWIDLTDDERLRHIANMQTWLSDNIDEAGDLGIEVALLKKLDKLWMERKRKNAKGNTSNG